MDVADILVVIMVAIFGTALTAGAYVLTRQLISGWRTGVLRAKSIEVSRSEEPVFFWSLMCAEICAGALAIAVCIILLWRHLGGK